MPEMITGAGPAPFEPATPDPAGANIDFSGSDDPFAAANEMAGRQQINLEDVREEGQAVNSEDLQQEPVLRTPAPQTRTQTRPPVPGQQTQTAAPQAPGKVRFSDGKEIDMKELEELYAHRNNMWGKVRSQAEGKYQEAAQLRKQAQQEYLEAKAMREQTEQLLGRIGGQQRINPQQQTQEHGLDEAMFSDPIVGPVAKYIQRLEGKLDQLVNYRDPYTEHQIKNTFGQLQQQLGQRYDEVIARIAPRHGINPDPRTGQFDLAKVEPGKALILAQEVQNYEKSVADYDKAHQQWVADAVNATSYVKAMPMVQDAVWARIVSAYENGEPVDANAVKFIVNSFERDIRSQLDSQRQAQIQTRQAAPKPIAPTGGASAVPTDNVEQFTVPKTADGEVDWGSLNRQALRAARLPSNRR